MKTHYETIDLVDYSRGLWPGDEAQSLFAHCQRCDDCGARLAAILALKGNEAVRRSSFQRTRKAAARAGVAAAAVLVFAGMAYFASPVASDGEESPMPTTNQDSQASSIVPDAPSDAITALATKDPPGDSYLRVLFGGLRGTRVSTSDWDARLQQAAEALWAGQVEAALPDLRILHRERPVDLNAATFLGIGRYLIGDRSEEVQLLLERGRLDEAQDALWERASWYLANHHLRNGDIERSVEILDELRERPNLIGAKALELRATLSEWQSTTFR